MAKNKGLTPHRKKEQRNPRVKHRMKYRKAVIRRKGAVREWNSTSCWMFLFIFVFLRYANQGKSSHDMEGRCRVLKRMYQGVLKSRPNNVLVIYFLLKGLKLNHVLHLFNLSMVVNSV